MRNRESWQAAFRTNPIGSTATRSNPFEPAMTSTKNDWLSIKNVLIDILLIETSYSVRYIVLLKLASFLRFLHSFTDLN